MKNKLPIFSLATFFLTFTSFSTLAADLVVFKDAPDCQLKKFTNGKWQLAEASEVEGKSLSVKPSKTNKLYSAFVLGDVWYSAPAKCFGVKSAKAAKVAKETKETQEASTSEIESEFLHQAKAGEFEITPAVNYHSTSVGVAFPPTTLTNMKISGIAFSLTPEYGINHYLSVGASFKYTNDTLAMTPATIQPNTSISGLSDPSVFINAQFEAGPGVIRTGASASFSLGNHTFNTSSNQNAASGGIGILPMVGYELPLLSGIFGAQFQYDYLATRTTDDSSSGTLLTSTSTGGSSWNTSLFYEKDFHPMLIGVAIQYLNSASSQTTKKTVITQNLDQGSAFGANLYGSYRLSEKLILLPSFIYMKPNFLPGTNAVNITGVSFWSVGLGVRYKL